MGLDEIGMTVTSTRHFFSGLLWVCHWWACLPWAWDLFAVGLGFACYGTSTCCGLFCFLFFGAKFCLVMIFHKLHGVRLG